MLAPLGPKPAERRQPALLHEQAVPGLEPNGRPARLKAGGIRHKDAGLSCARRSRMARLPDPSVWRSAPPLRGQERPGRTSNNTPKHRANKQPLWQTPLRRTIRLTNPRDLHHELRTAIAGTHTCSWPAPQLTCETLGLCCGPAGLRNHLNFLKSNSLHFQVGNQNETSNRIVIIE